MSSKLNAPVEFLETYGISTKIILVVLGIVMSIVTFNVLDLQANVILRYTFYTAPVWLPVIMFLLFFEHWMYYVRKQFELDYGRTTLEIRLPQEILKSPEAMELVLTQLYQTASPDNLFETYLDGKKPPVFSLEIASRGGEVTFYINIPKKRWKDLIEAQFYAHYPGVEIQELDVDYTAEIIFDRNKYMYFSMHCGLKRPDALPIKTYIDFGLDKMPKEEEKNDPITATIEAFASMAPHERLWMQILIDANRGYGFKEGSLTKKEDWKGAARAHIKKIIDDAKKRAGIKPDEPLNNAMMILTDSEKDTIKAIERSISKYAFNTAIRVIYITPLGKIRIGDIVPRVLTMWKAFDDLNRNQIGLRWRTDFDYPMWQDPKGERRWAYRKAQLDYYKRRYYQEYSHIDSPKVMTVEELATLWHFPGKVATTPSLRRIPSKRAEAPSNLPVG